MGRKPPTKSPLTSSSRLPVPRLAAHASGISVSDREHPHVGWFMINVYTIDVLTNHWLVDLFEGLEESPLTTGFYDDRWYSIPNRMVDTIH